MCDYDIIYYRGVVMKLIGIVGRVYSNKDNQEIIQLNDCIRRVLSSYNDVVSTVILPTNSISYLDINMGDDELGESDKKKLDYILSMCDGFIIPGGTYWYSFDEYVIRHAIETKKPLLAICAGFQGLCSMFAKDRDKFDMTNRFLGSNNHYGKGNEYVHEVMIEKNTLLSRILDKDSIMVNSLHHDYVDFLMDGLKISSFSKDNVVEAVELVEHPFLLGVEWHPEYLDDNNSKKIFDYFVDSIKKTQ